MSLEENKAIARRHFEELWTKGDLAVADEICSPSTVGHCGSCRTRRATRSARRRSSAKTSSRSPTAWRPLKTKSPRATRWSPAGGFAVPNGVSSTAIRRPATRSPSPASMSTASSTGGSSRSGRSVTSTGCSCRSARSRHRNHKQCDCRGPTACVVRDDHHSRSRLERTSLIRR